MATALVRHPAVAGQVLSQRPRSSPWGSKYLSKSDSSAEGIRALGCIAPHAGYMYSGHVAGAVFAGLEVPELCVVMCPNHTGMGRPLAIVSDGSWETPLGAMPIASEFAISLKQQCSLLHEDSTAHRSEHAIEVELPFLQIRQPRLRLVPIALGTGQFEALEQLGIALAEAVVAHRNPVLIVASSDMNHYESDAITRVKDQNAIEPILRLDPRGLHDVVTQQHVSMCGFGPAVTMLTAVKSLGATSAELVKYATSGDISGDRDAVVGYAGIAVR